MQNSSLNVDLSGLWRLACVSWALPTAVTLNTSLRWRPSSHSLAGRSEPLLVLGSRKVTVCENELNGPGWGGGARRGALDWLKDSCGKPGSTRSPRCHIKGWWTNSRCWRRPDDTVHGEAEIRRVIANRELKLLLRPYSPSQDWQAMRSGPYK